jgi:hypothetical protein
MSTFSAEVINGAFAFLGLDKSENHAFFTSIIILDPFRWLDEEDVQQSKGSGLVLGVLRLVLVTLNVDDGSGGCCGTNTI